jgi:predicted Zn-dependent peptidase
MTELLFEEISGEAGEYYKHEQKIRAVTLEQVKKLASELIKKYSSAAIVPRSSKQL